MADARTYSVGETGKVVGIAPSTVRLWVRELTPVLSAGANPKPGISRRFTDDDCAALHTAKIMRRTEGVDWTDIIKAIEGGNLILPPPREIVALAEGDSEAIKIAVMSGQITELRDQLALEREARIAAERRAIEAEVRLQLLAAPAQSQAAAAPDPGQETPATPQAPPAPDRDQPESRPGLRQRLGRWIAGGN